jgi:hypothetical protein
MDNNAPAASRSLANMVKLANHSIGISDGNVRMMLMLYGLCIHATHLNRNEG